MRVAFYVRVSTQRQQQAQTIEQQVSRLWEYVATQPTWTVAEEHIFRDDGYSGAKLNRPGLDALRDQAARAAFALVVCTAPDRLARNYVQQMVVLEELSQHGCRVHCIDRPLSDAPHEQLLLQIRGAVAEYERTLIVDRLRRGRQAKLRSGRLLPWTRPPYGYRLDPERPRDPAGVRVDAAEAVIVQELFASYATGTKSLYALVQTLTKRHVPSPTGKDHWRSSSLRGLLTNPVYAGLATSGRYEVIPAQKRRSPLQPVGDGQSTRQRPAAEWISVPVPALVSTEQFALVQQRLASNRQGAMRNTKHDYLLRSLVSCGVCQLACTGRTRFPDNDRYRYYICRGKREPVESSCSASYIPAMELDQLVWEDLCQILAEPERVTEALARAQSQSWLPEDLRRRQATLRGTREGLARQRQRLLEAYLAGVIELAVFAHKDGEMRQREADLAAQEQELAVHSQHLVELSTIMGSTTAICERLGTGLQQATFAQRRQLVELLIDRVVVTHSTVEIRYVIPTTDASAQTRFCHLHTDYLEDQSLPWERRISQYTAGPGIAPGVGS